MKNKYLNEALRMERDLGRKSILAFAQFFLPHHLKYGTSKAHREIYKVLYAMTRERGKKFAIAGPRRFGKTTLITFIYVLYGLCYGTEKFSVIITNTASDAVSIIGNIKKEFRENNKIISVFPEVCRANMTSKLFRCWQKNRIVTANNIQVLALSAGQNIRGQKFGADRPTLIIADDLENARNTFSSDSREKTKDNFEKAILMAGSEETNFIFIGNLFHPHCLLSEYVRNDESNPWMHKRYAAIEKMPDRIDLWDAWSSIHNFKQYFNNMTGPKAALAFYEKNKASMDKGAVILWPERYTLYGLMLLRDENEISFMNEMQNEPIDPRQVVFHTDEFHYWDENGKRLDSFLRELEPDVEFFGACDPALGKSMEKGDFSAIVVLAKCKNLNTFYVIAADIQRRPIDELIEDILSYCIKYKFTKFGIESNNFQVLVTQNIKRRAEEHGIRVAFEEINNKNDKKTRIQLLKLWTKNGSLQFSKKHKKLLEECRYFPKGKFDDGLDALEMALSLARGKKTLDADARIKLVEKFSGELSGGDPNEFFIQGGKYIDNQFRLLKGK